MKTLQQLNNVTHYGVKYRNTQEPFIDTTHPLGDLLAAFVAKVAEMERDRIRERVKAGLDKARAKGTGVRPIKGPALHAQGHSYAKVAP